ncbi:putative exported protein precursor [Chitinispirillum alkaliphilum]|nr:putative exported protein precursor [Chitinispirillum alkaliphilum]
MRATNVMTRIIVYFALSLGGIVLLIFFLLSVPWIRREILDIAQEQINQQIEGDIYIEDFNTNIFTFITLEGIRGGTGKPLGDTLFIRQLHISYFLPSLLFRHININEISINQGIASAFRDRDEKLHFPLLPREDLEPAPENGEWNFTIDRFEAEEFSLQINDLATEISAQLSLSSVLSIKTDTISATLSADEGFFASPQFQGPIDSLFTSAHLVQDLPLTINRLFIKSDSASFELGGDIPLEPRQYWDLFALISVPINDVPPDFNGNTVDLGGRMNLELSANGPQLSPFGDINLFSENLVLEGFSVDSFIVRSTYSIPDSLRSDLTFESEAGNISATAKLLFDRNPDQFVAVENYELEAFLSQIGITEILGRLGIFLPLSPVWSDGFLKVSGNGADFTNPDTVAIAKSFNLPAPYRQEPFDLSFLLTGHQWRLDAVTGSGNYFQGRGDFFYDLVEGEIEGELTNTELISSLFITPPIEGIITVNGIFNGPPTQPEFTLSLNSPNLFWQGIQIDSLSADISYRQDTFTLLSSLIKLRAQLDKVEPLPPDISGDFRAEISVEGTIGMLRGAAVIDADNFRYENYRIDRFTAELSYHDNSLILDQYGMQIADFSLQGQGGVDFDQKDYRLALGVSLFHLQQAIGEIDILGSLSDDSISGSVSVVNLHTAPFIGLTQLPPTEGVFDMELTLNGTLHSPTGDMNYSLVQNISNDFYAQLRGSITLQEDTLEGKNVVHVTGTDLPDDNEMIILFNLPVRYDFENPIQDGANVSIHTEKFSLGPFLDQFIPYLESDMSLDLDGFAQKENCTWKLQGGSVIAVDSILFRDEQIRIDTLEVTMFFDGTIEAPKISIYTSRAPITYRGLQAYFDTSATVITKERAVVDTLTMKFPDEGYLSANASFPFFPVNDKPPLYGLELNFDLKNIALQFLSPFIPGVTITSGKLNGKGEVIIEDNYNFDGFVSIDTLFLEPDAINREIGPINAELKMSQNEFTIEGTGSLNGGFSLDGSVTFDENGIDSIDISLTGERIRFELNNMLDIGFQKFDFKITGKENRIDSLSGMIILDETRFYQYIELLELIDMIRAVAIRPTIDPPAFLENADLNFDLHINRNLIIKTNLGRFLLDGRFLIDGTPLDPQINGEFRLAVARIKYIEREFELRDGFIRRFQPAMVDPLIDVRATTSIRAFLFDDQRDYSISLALTGSALEPEFALSSYPPLEEEQIVNLLTTGTITALPGFITEPDEIISIYTGAAVAWRIREWFNLTNADISGNFFELTEEDGPRLTLMERFNERIFITYLIHIAQPNIQGARIHYRITPFFYTAGSLTTQGEGNIEFWLYMRR